MNRLMMDVTLSQAATHCAAKAPRGTARLAVAIAFAGVILSCCGPASWAEGTPLPGEGTLEVSGVDPQFAAGSGGVIDPAYEVPGGGLGFLTRIGHIAGETVGLDDSITHVGLAPYLFHEETMLFGDLRMFRTNEGRTGGSAGLGLRHYFIDHDAIFGVAGYYDNDDSRGTRFHQVGLSLEYLSRLFDARVNWYVPVGETERILGTNIVNGTQRFVEHRLLFDSRTEFGSAADGVDLLLSTPIPGEIPENFNLEVSAGAYHYQARDSNTAKVWGYRLRTDADLFKRILHMFAELTSDRVNNTNVMVGASLNYYHGFENRNRLRDCQFYRMSEWVRRNYTVVTIDDFVINEGELARNPDTDQPYFFEHVRNIPGAQNAPPIPIEQPPFFNFPAPTGIGTVNRPFQFIQEAQDALQDPMTPPIDRNNGVIYVHGDSVFTGSDAVVVLNENEILLGEGQGDGIVQSLPVAGFTDELMLPVVIPGGSTPVLDMATGDAITAGSGNMVSGFVIQDPDGNGITIDGREDGEFSDIMINNAGGDGILMTDNTGVFPFDRVLINNADGVGFHVDGGTAMITVADPDGVALGTPTIANMQEEALLIENTTGGFVNLAATLIDDNGGAGIRLIDNVGNVTLGQAMLDDTTFSSDPASVGAGIEIRGASGITTLSDNVMITNAAGIGFLVSDLATTGRVNPSGNVTINSRNDIGAEFSNIDGIVQFGASANLTIGALAAADTTHPAIRFHNGSVGSVILNDFTIVGSMAEGILIGDPDGTMINEPGAIFRTLGTGLISDTTDAAVSIRGAEGAEDPTLVDFRGLLTSNTRLGRGIHIEDTSGSIGFAGATTINNNNAAPSGLSALFIDDASGPIAFGTFTANDNLAPEPAVDIQNVTAPGGVRFASLNIAGAMGTRGLEVRDTSLLTTLAGTIAVAGERAVDIEGTTVQVELTSVSSTDSPDFGIRLVNTPGSFAVIGDTFTLASGGTISGAATAGAFFDNTEDVFLNFQDYTANAIGIMAQNINVADGPNEDENDDAFVFLNQLRISDSIAQGVFLEDVRNATIQDSTFTNNGTGAVLGTQQHILITALTNPNLDDLTPGETIEDILPSDPDFDSFVYLIQRNLFVDTATVIGDDAVFIQTMGANAAFSSIQLTFIDNVFNFDRVTLLTARPSALEVDWNGFLFADINRNTVNILGSGNGQTGIRVATQGFDTNSSVNINQNIINGSAGDGNGDNLIGIDVALVGPADITVAQNAIDFVTPATIFTSNNFGLRFTFIDGSKNVDIVDNLIVMDEGTAISIPQSVSPTGARSTFFIEGNQIGTVLRAPNRGIFFGPITGTVNLLGTRANTTPITPNIVTPAIFTIPVLSSGGQPASSGTINVNGFFVPPLP